MDKNTYSNMQQTFYDNLSQNWSLNNKNPVVGGFDNHNAHEDYNTYLFKDCKKFNSCLDFACGPGRNIVKFNDKFKTFDGVDICQTNLNNAKLWLEQNKCNLDKTKLIKCNGQDLTDIKSNSYDVVMSTIALQHICVHEIRQGYFEEFYRVLKKGGRFTAQMGFGTGRPGAVGYYENNYNAPRTNGSIDCSVTDPNQLKNDLEKIGFKDFKHYIRPVGPGDHHPNWIFFSAEK